METTATLFIVIILGLLILQIVMIVKFFQIASDVRAIKRQGGVSLGEQYMIAVEQYLGHEEKAKELLIKARVMLEEEAIHARLYGNNFDKNRVIQINDKLTQIGIDPDELIRKIFVANGVESGNYEVGSIVVDRETGMSWQVGGRNNNQLYCTSAGQEKYFQISQVMPLEEWNRTMK